ncbi:MAG TPA: glycosyltransferase family 39 protein [Anaerolineales bacterium]|jgi:hypothetical protein
MKEPISTSFFGSYRVLALVLLFVMGLSIRLYDLTDLPLDFHPTRQLLSALKARGMYYQGRGDVPEWQRQFAVQQWRSKAEIEPEIVERLAAATYSFTGEQLWVGRLYSSLFWLIGGFFLFLLARDLVSLDGALITLALYLFLSYAVIASRSFQPDPLMVMFIIAFWRSVNRWAGFLEPGRREVRKAKTKSSRPSPRSLPREWRAGKESWAWAIAAGLLGGLAILVKFSSVFFVIGGGVGVLLGREPLKQAMRRPQVWAMAALGVLPGASYLIYGVYIGGFLGRQFGGRFIPPLLVSPAFYLNWIAALDHVLGGAVLMLALLGLFFFRERSTRVFVTALWIAYFLYGIFFDYHIWSHDYYNLPLIPLAALSLAGLADWFMARLTEAVDGSRRRQIAAASILTLGLVAVLLDVHSVLGSSDYRPEAARWMAISAQLGPQARVTGLTEDYGSRLAYWGWLDSAAWPLSGDLSYHSDLRGAQDDFQERFAQLALKRDFFLVTLPDELDLQPLLKQRLADYPIFAQGGGYVIYDLR